MHFERTNLPADVHEVFFSDVYFYASSSARNTRGRPLYVGCGRTRDAAVAEMRQDARKARRMADMPAPRLPKPEPAGADVVLLSEHQRQALARNLQWLRTERKVSQMDVARALGFEKSHAAVSRLERGTLAQVAAARLQRLADFFGTTATGLLQATD